MSTPTTAVYSAEQMLCRLIDTGAPVELAGSTITLPADRKFADVNSVQAYVDAVLALNWVKARWNPGPIRVRARRGTTKAHYQLGEIAVPVTSRWALREVVVLHEIAHHLAFGDQHGATFRETHRELLDGCVSAEAAWALQVLYHQHGAA